MSAFYRNTSTRSAVSTAPVMLPLLVLVTLLSAVPADSLKSPLNRRYPADVGRKVQPGVGDAGDPLFLTPLIEAGEYEQAREQSRVRI